MLDALKPKKSTQFAHQVQLHTIYKFGGTSLSTANKIKQACALIQRAGLGCGVVVSANGAQTDALISLCKQPEPDLQPALNALIAWQSALAKKVLPHLGWQTYHSQLEKDANQLLQLYHNAKHNDIIAFGEIWSARLLAAALIAHGSHAHAIDTREFLKVSHQTELCFSTSQANLSKVGALPQDATLIFTGFIASDKASQTVLLGRNGSDYSATALARLLGAKHLTLWTDVAGVFSADPNKVKGAIPRRFLHFQHALALAQLGSDVLHPRTLSHLSDDQLAITIANTDDFGQQSTQLGHRVSQSDWVMTDLTHCTLLPLTDIPSDQPIYCHFEKEDKALALSAFQPEKSQTRAGALAIVGHFEREHEACFSAFFSKQKIQPVAILAQQNALIAILNDPPEASLLEALHAYWHDITNTITVGLLGPGQVGSEVIELVEKLKSAGKLPAKLALVGNSTRVSDKGTPCGWQHHLKERGNPYTLKAFSQQLKNISQGKSVIIDTTASEDVAAHYQHFFNDGHDVITANKLAGSGNITHYQELQQHPSQNWLYEATVGAGLPIIATLKQQLRIGDQIKQIKTACSGSMAFILAKVNQGIPLFDAMMLACEKGLTEPDPRVDFSGLDIARKCVILARELGWDLTLEEVTLPITLSPYWRDLPLWDFIQKRDEFNAYAQDTLSDLIYPKKDVDLVAIATVNQQGASISYSKVPNTDAFYGIKEGDNVFFITSQFYPDLPLTIKGPGAGAKVTAAGIVSDLHQLLQKNAR